VLSPLGPGILKPTQPWLGMSLNKVVVPIHPLVRITRIPVRDQRLASPACVPLLLYIGARRICVVHRGIECVGEGIGGAYELGESGVDVGRRDVEAAATALGGRMGEAERLPEIVVAREGKKGAGDVLEVDELGGFEVWASVRTGRGLRAMGTDGCYLQEIMWRMSSSGRWIMVSGEDENCGNNNDKMDGC
jgi:hypothetical protein